jgi:hypothetical protein
VGVEMDASQFVTHLEYFAHAVVQIEMHSMVYENAQTNLLSFI